jgi:hypothetical protein
MSFTVDHSYQLMGTAELTRLRQQAMISIARGGSIPEPVRLYIRTLEALYLDSEARQRSTSCSDMWDQFKGKDTAS